MIVYIDVLFLENFIINYLILYIGRKIIKNRGSILSLIYASLIATLYSIITIMFYIDISVLRIAIVMLMCYIAYKPNQIIELVKYSILIYMLTLTIGGFLISNYNIKHLYLMLTLGVIIIYESYKFMKKFMKNQQNICRLLIEINEEKIYADVLIDTGHSLKDNITNAEVIALDRKLIKNQELLDVLDNKNFNIPLEYETKIRMITYSVLGNNKNIKTGIAVDNVVIDYDDERIINQRAVLILNEYGFGRYDGVISFDLIEGGKLYGNNDAYKIKG